MTVPFMIVTPPLLPPRQRSTGIGRGTLGV